MPKERQPSSTRERFREQIREEVKELAVEQLIEGGPQAISLNAIAKQLGVSGSALYRYYSNRDDLINALIIQAYTDLRDALATAAAASVDAGGTTERVRALASAYRDWACQHPGRYELLFKPPLPGYDAHAAPLAEAARSLMGVLLSVLAGSAAENEHTHQLGNEEVLSARAERSDHFRRAVRIWTRLHGLVSLEIGGAFNAMYLDADELFNVEVQLLTA